LPKVQHKHLFRKERMDWPLIAPSNNQQQPDSSNNNINGNSNNNSNNNNNNDTQQNIANGVQVQQAAQQAAAAAFLDPLHTHAIMAAGNLGQNQAASDLVSIPVPVVVSNNNNNNNNNNNILVDEDLHGLDKWKNDNEHLRKCAGKEQVMVEVRSNDNDSFGRGNEKRMSFHTFLDLVEGGDSKHYLTTQDVAANDDGQPDLMADFMKTLKDDFPLRPKLIGNLVPQNINIWMGNNRDGASSGLHHDYHDNLYIVLRGQKNFRLYSPKDTEKIYSRGKLLKVHPNGRINYEGEETTAYGADLKADAAAKASQAKEDAEQELIEAEKAVEEGVQGAQERLEKAEERLEQAMDALIDAEMGSDDDHDGGFGVGFSDCDDDDDDDDDQGDKDEKHDGHKGKNDKCNDEDFNDFPENDVFDTEENFNASKGNLVDKTVKDPNNFSIINPKILLDEEQLSIKFPEMKHTTPAFCSLSPGDILYLPASWWHEVNSVGGAKGHLAMNYWFHPPDSSDDFKSPYSTNFWHNDYNLRFNRQITK